MRISGESTFGIVREILGHPMVSFECRCEVGFDVTVMLRDEDQARAAMLEHLVDHHAVEWAGRCAECLTITDYLHAVVTGQGLDAWLCEKHAPTPMLLDQAAEQG